LWDRWRSAGDERIHRFTIITILPNELCAELRNRMPAVLKPEAWPLWLGEQPARTGAGQGAAGPLPVRGHDCWPVSPHAGSVKNKDPVLVEPIDLP
jgi:putative SOS response-associated peptidase YedK